MTIAHPIVYGPVGRTSVWSARLALAEKGVTHELVEVPFGAHREEPYLSRQPFAKVPAFEHDGFALYAWYFTSEASGTPDLNFFGGEDTYYDTRTRAAGLDFQYRRYIGSYGAQGFFVAPGLEVQRFIQQLTRDPESGRTVQRSEHEGLVEALRARMKSAAANLKFEEAVRVRIGLLRKLAATREPVVAAHLPFPSLGRVAVEAACAQGWERWIGPEGSFLGMHTFGESGPAKDVYEHFGITAGHAVELSRDALQRAAVGSAGER